MASMARIPFGVISYWMLNFLLFFTFNDHTVIVLAITVSMFYAK